MKVGRWLFDKPCEEHMSLVQAPGVRAQLRLKIPRGDSK
jgi:hypothetical protein